MRILHVTQSMNPAHGGVTEAIRLFCAESVRQGHSVEIVTMDSPESNWVRNSQFPMHCFPQSMKGFRAPGLESWLAENGSQFDGVIVYGIWRCQGHATRVAAKKGGFDYFVLPAGMLDPWFKKDNFLKHLGKQLYWIWREYRVLRDAKAVLFCCEEEERQAPTFMPYKVNAKICLLGLEGPPVDPKHLSKTFFDQYPRYAGKTNILFLGRIHHKKGVDLLIEAFARCANRNDANLLIAGPYSPSLKETYQVLANRLGISDRVFWLGMLTGNEKWGALSAADVFILPSHQENFGIAVVEALACGTPVLISNKVNIWQEIVSDGAGCVNDDTVEGTVELLETFLEMTPQDCDQLSSNAIRCFNSKFRSEVATKRLLKIVKNCNLTKG